MSDCTDWEHRQQIPKHRQFVFNMFSPRQILSNSSTEYVDAEMKTLAKGFPRLRESDLLFESSSYRLKVGSPDLKVLYIKLH